MQERIVFRGQAQSRAPGDVVLRELHARGELIDLYPTVPRLLVDLDEAALLRSGTLLSQLNPDVVIGRHPDLPVATVAVVGSSTTRPLASPLSAQLARHGFVPRIQVGSYRQYAIELRQAHNTPFSSEPDVTVCLLDAHEVFDRLRTPWTTDDVQRVLDEVGLLLEELANAYQENHPGTLVFNTIPLPRSWAAQLIDFRSRAQLGAAWREFNARLLRFAADRPGVLVIDTEPLIGESQALSDPVGSCYAKVQFSDSFFSIYSREIGHVVRALSGRASKCLVLDLDGTLWGGVLAEDGPQGIEVREGFHGEAFHSFQKAVKQIASQGTLVAICSKNDEDLVREALYENRNLALHGDDLAAIVANWGAKPDNLAQIAEQLHVAPESLVFVDDSPSERAMIRNSFPRVPVIDIDDEPALHVHRLLADGWFAIEEVTEDDIARRQRYLAEQHRLRFQERTESLDEYLTGLGTSVELRHATAADATRISQITQRTTQFNLTATRLDTAAVLRCIDEPSTEVIVIRSADRFGEHGMVGAFFATWWENTFHLDNFLLSCRVLARRVESACVLAVLNYAKQNGATRVVADFRETARNQRAKDFYPRHGFTPVDGPDNTARFSHDLRVLPSPVPHIEMTVQLERISQEGHAN